MAHITFPYDVVGALMHKHGLEHKLTADEFSALYEDLISAFQIYSK